MRVQAVASEAWRNVTCGTAHALRWAFILAVIAGGLTVADLRSIVAVLNGAEQFRDAGAAVQVLTADQGIDGARCEELNRLAGVTAAGALRKTDPVTLAVLPSTDVPFYEVTPGFLALLELDRAGQGVALPSTLAAAIGPSQSIEVEHETVALLGSFDYPADGRTATLEYAVVGPVSSAGVFDACWVEVWPSNLAVTAILPYALTDVVAASSDAGAVAIGQLNSRLGETYDAYRLTTERLTAPVGLFAALAGLLIGGAAVTARRIELASARHAGVGRGPLALQAGFEAVAWATAGFLLAAPVLCVGASYGNPASVAPVLVVGAAAAAAAAGAAVVGAIIVTLLVREKQLFRYFKDR